MRTGNWIPPDVDTNTPSIARIYDYWLGGGHNFEIDRATADKLEGNMAGVRQSVRLNRAFLARAVRYMASQGVKQFIDIGSGIPTVGNVHEIAQQVNPEARVVYVEREPVAVAHSDLLLAGDEQSAMVHADMRDVEGVLGSPQVRRLIDFDEPVGLLFLLMLHWLEDSDDPAGLVRAYQEPLVPGSMMAVSHLTDDARREHITEMTGMMVEHRAGEPIPRSHDEIVALFGELELVEPGLVGCGNWRPAGPGDVTEDSQWNQYLYAGVARKP
ncbi:SAM-dependent methyltransferase [Allokutzneria sp. A3M-2-11 16]|uniref:SAM-dependent methyltransferase n=1 Tax=Allokutzneria sp. A3M-2-11 16 TaxID=2962043 RepID=UPI0020B6889E|nr:SAM-dependent methyltransferase [Allokutzneria sp. A3M-2-11 16]MCP3798436.1 SAM-dependent methyltransferase [Allokutzneria sp. A3M-2-11 16]